MTRVSAPLGELIGVGVDVIDLSRAKVFLGKHRERAERLLSANERKMYWKQKCSALLFSKLFAAKEAYFKACGGEWLGIEGFSTIDVKIGRKGAFEAWSKTIRPPRGHKSCGVFFRRGPLIGAEVVIWN